MKKTNKNLMLLSMLFVMSLVISNVVTGKTIDTGIPLFGASIIVPGAALCYAITFLITDVVGEIWGKEEANAIVKFGFFGQIGATLLIVITQYLPASDPEMQSAYVKLLGQNWIFVIASLTAYLVSQNWDVFFFHKLRDKFNADPKKRWIWNNGSTMTSQILDTVIFIGIAFGLGFGWLLDPAMRPTLFAMMVGQYLLKALLALCDTPFFYFLTRQNKSEVLDKEVCIEDLK